MNSDLMNPSGEGSADDYARAVAAVQSLELGPALLAVRTDLAHSDLVAHDFDRLRAFSDASAKTISLVAKLTSIMIYAAD